MSKLCEFGIHAYRHVHIIKKISTYYVLTRCKRCKLEKTRYTAYYPARIRTYNWSSEKKSY